MDHGSFRPNRQPRRDGSDDAEKLHHEDPKTPDLVQTHPVQVPIWPPDCNSVSGISGAEFQQSQKANHAQWRANWENVACCCRILFAQTKANSLLFSSNNFLSPSNYYSVSTVVSASVCLLWLSNCGCECECEC